MGYPIFEFFFEWDMEKWDTGWSFQGQAVGVGVIVQVNLKISEWSWPRHGHSFCELSPFLRADL